MTLQKQPLASGQAALGAMSTSSQERLIQMLWLCPLAIKEYWHGYQDIYSLSLTMKRRIITELR